jgi:hypothetical protein
MIISLISINQFDFVTGTQYVICEVGTESINII